MNRVFIIGNGFDLAHGLPTSYNHFINDFWINLKVDYKEQINSELLHIDDSYTGFFDFTKPTKCFNDFIQNIKDYANERECRFDEKKFRLKKSRDQFQFVFEFKNELFLTINKNQSIDNWVDIENLYYSELKKIVKSKSLNVTESDESWARKSRKRVATLNKEFKQIEDLLKSYLTKIVDNYNFEPKDDEWMSFYQLFKPISLFNNESKLLEEFMDSEDKDSIQGLFDEQKKSNAKTRTTSYFLSFNYTPTLYRYVDSLKSANYDIRLNQIHGKVEDDIVFGFGDESDIDYHLIEDINDNEYLNFFKSFKYLENNNYNNFLNFIDSEPFQLIIMGHSLGLSDRVLLKTVVENDNCKSIKVYFYEGNEGDNFKDIIQNMSRHFSEKSLMRKKVVNKLLCEPLPQLNIPLK
tara:strand:- start:301 stop:1527 length:1227 start_codon:yes stop_codon:yes gene_type:complete